MDDWNEAEDPYKILQLDKGSEVTEAEIKKVSAVHLFAEVLCLTTSGLQMLVRLMLM